MRRMLSICWLMLVFTPAILFAQSSGFPFVVWGNADPARGNVYRQIDSCGFTHIVTYVSPAKLASIDSSNLKVIASNSQESFNPYDPDPMGWPYYYSSGTYFRWELEIPHQITGYDLTEAGGIDSATARFWNEDTDSAGTIVTGPSCYLLEKRAGVAITYTANYRMKIDDKAVNDTVATIHVFRDGQLIAGAEKVLFADSFQATNVYQSFSVSFTLDGAGASQLIAEHQ